MNWEVETWGLYFFMDLVTFQSGQGNGRHCWVLMSELNQISIHLICISCTSVLVSCTSVLKTLRHDFISKWLFDASTNTLRPIGTKKIMWQPIGTRKIMWQPIAELDATSHMSRRISSTIKYLQTCIQRVQDIMQDEFIGSLQILRSFMRFNSFQEF